MRAKAKINIKGSVVDEKGKIDPYYLERGDISNSRGYKYN